MNIKRSIQINGVDYTNKLLSISDISIGVRDLGLGYISDITAELVFDGSLLDVKGKNAVVGILVNGKGYVYKGIVRNAKGKNNKATLNISHKLSSIKFKPLKTISFQRDDNSNKVYKIPVIYGNGRSFFAKTKALYTVDINEIPGARKYRWLVGDKPFSGSVQYGNAYCIDDFSVFTTRSSTVDSNIHDWLELIEEYGTWGTAGSYRRYKVKAYQINDQNILAFQGILNSNVYGGKNNGDGTIDYTSIPEIGIGKYVIEDKYDEIKFEWANKGEIGVYQPKVSIYSSAPVTKDNDIIGERSITMYSFDKPADIAKDIIDSNGFSGEIKGYGTAVQLNFQSEESYSEILQRVAEMGLLYIVPTLGDKFEIYPVSGNPIETLSENDFLIDSFETEDKVSEVDKLKVVWNKEKGESFYGSGDKEKEYKADFIVDQTSVNNFANAYLDYYQKQRYVSFETPLYPTYLDLNVGDVITVNHSFYGINQDFQIIEKSIRDESIKFKCKEV